MKAQATEKIEKDKYREPPPTKFFVGGGYFVNLSLTKFKALLVVYGL